MSASFGYDGLGRRRAKTNVGAGTGFLYGGVNAVQELSGATPTANLLTGLAIDEYFTRTDASGLRAFLTDALRSTEGLTDGAGTVATEYTYDPFGRTITGGASSGNTFAFTGREADGTGLYSYRARYYHPALSRFISEDRLALGGADSNLYRYVWNSPTNLVDPVGELGIGLSVGGAVEGGVIVVGAGAQAAVGAGAFVDTNTGTPSTGAFASGGAFARWPGGGRSAPSQPGNRNWAFGAYAGGGASILLSNANNVCDLAGPFRTYSFNAGWIFRAVTFQLSFGSNAAGRTIVVFNCGGPLPYVPVTGVGFVGSLSGYNTNTVTTGGRGCGCR